MKFIALSLLFVSLGLAQSADRKERDKRWAGQMIGVIVLGRLYGERDMGKTIEIATRGETYPGSKETEIGIDDLVTFR
jgi:hypothetical protein